MRILNWLNSDDPLQTGIEIYAKPPGKAFKHQFVVWR